RPLLDELPPVLALGPVGFRAGLGAGGFRLHSGFCWRRVRRLGILARGEGWRPRLSRTDLEGHECFSKSTRTTDASIANHCKSVATRWKLNDSAALDHFDDWGFGDRGYVVSRSVA